MAGLKGRSDGSVDAKGRLSIPSKYRKLLPEELVLCTHPDEDLPALVLYTPDEFDVWIDKVLEAKGGEKVTDAQQRRLVDKYYQNAADVTPDSIGRITIPSFLRDYAGIQRDVVITGARDHLIIRTPEILEQSLKDFASVTVYETPASSTIE